MFHIATTKVRQKEFETRCGGNWLYSGNKSTDERKKANEKSIP